MEWLYRLLMRKDSNLESFYQSQLDLYSEELVRQTDNSINLLNQLHERDVEIERLNTQMNMLRELIANDAFAASFQSMGQYRSVLLNYKT